MPTELKWTVIVQSWVIECLFYSCGWLVCGGDACVCVLLLAMQWQFASGGSCRALTSGCRNLVFHNMAVPVIRTNRLPVGCNEDKWRQPHPFKVDSGPWFKMLNKARGFFPRTGNAQVMRFTLPWEMTSNAVLCMREKGVGWGGVGVPFSMAL